MKKLALLIALPALLLSSCNTAIGLGRDLRWLGSNMENKARSNTSNPETNSNVPSY
jgi:predicted small secreted protein